MSQSSHYTFGESELAAERLRLLAQAFEPSSSALLRQLRRRVHTFTVAVDLGCGPGYTTELLASCLQPARTIGLDRSEALLALARARASGSLEFLTQDVTQTPLVSPLADLIYSRYLLTHLPNTRQVLCGWKDGLLPGGRLVLEENTELRSTDAAFQRYYELVERLQRNYGQHMYVGVQLPGLCEQAGFSLEHAEVRELQLPAAVMARLHALNIRTWSRDAFAKAHFDAAELAYLEEQLRAVAEKRRDAPHVQCGMQQVVARNPARAENQLE